MFHTVYLKKSFPSKESDTKILQSIYFAFEVGITSSYSNRMTFGSVTCLEALHTCLAVLHEWKS